MYYINIKIDRSTTESSQLQHLVFNHLISKKELRKQRLSATLLLLWENQQSGPRLFTSWSFFFVANGNIWVAATELWGQIIKPTWDMAHVFLPWGIHLCIARKIFPGEKKSFSQQLEELLLFVSKYTTFISLRRALRLMLQKCEN